MTTEVVNELLSAEGAILNDPTDVEHALTALWKTAGQKPDEETSTEAKTRVCMANLVLVARADDWDDLSAVLARLDWDYPTRTLALLLGDPQMGDEGPHLVRAAVSSVCHIPHPGRPQVCAEQVLLRTGSQDGTGMDRVLLPLLASDMPLVGWWIADPARCAELLNSLRQATDRLIFDAGLAAFPRLLDAGRHLTRELGWFRSYRWRELIARMFDDAPPATPGAIDRVTMVIQGGIPTDRIDALWMMSFLAGQLGWRPNRVLGSGRFEFHSSAGTVEAAIEDRGGPGRGLNSFDVQAAGGHFQFTRSSQDTDEFRIMISNAEACSMPGSIQMSRRDRADSLAVALTGRAVDYSYQRAVPLAVWMAEALTAASNDQSGA